MARPKHQTKELEALLREAEAKGWRVEKGGKYFKMYCPCAKRHKQIVHLTPSNPRYEQNLRGHLNRATCWNTKEAE